MDIESFRTYCLAKKGVTETFPFDENTLVFKVMGKMFALTNIDGFESVNLKCDPLLSLELRVEFEAIEPGYHMSKKHWNTITLDYSIEDNTIYEWIKDSYNLVVDKLTKKQKEELNSF